MPRTLPAGMVAFLKNQGGTCVPIILLDVQTLDGSQYFWSDYEGYFPSKFLLGTRIQTSGGSSTQQYALGLGTTVAGDLIFVSMVVKNQGAKTVAIGTNGNGGDPSATIAPGQTGLVKISGVSVGNGLQITFNVQAVGDALDLVCFNPIATKNGNANLVPFANSTFIGWAVVGAATVTVTQQFDVAPLQFYNGWIKSAAPFRRARDLSTNAGSLVLQNLSGNTIDRDVASALKNHELEGALAIMRLWLPLFDGVMNEFHCYLSEQNPTEDECSFRLLQLFDPSQYNVAADVITQDCTLRFKSLQCGSTGTATVCDKAFSTCKDATHLAQERFNAVLTVVSTAGINKPRLVPGGGNRGGDPGSGAQHGGNGRRRFNVG